MGSYIVYKHTSPSGKSYIGITGREPSKRWENGRGYRKHEHFWSAIEKYGWEQFSHETLKDGMTKEEAENAEKFLIQIFRSTDPQYGYNKSLGGESGLKVTDETRQKISKSLRDYYKSHPEVVEQMRNRQLGTRHSEETKRKMSETHKAMVTDEMRTKMSERMKGNNYHTPSGYHHSEETKQKISNSKKGKHYGGHGRKPKSVVCVETGEVYKSAVVAAESVGIHFEGIYRCCNGQRESAGGYRWQYAV